MRYGVLVACVSVWAVMASAETVRVPGFACGAVEVTADAPVTAVRIVESDGAETAEVSVQVLPDGQYPEVKVGWSFPHVDIRQAWAEGFAVNHDGVVKGRSHLTSFAPVYAFKSASDENRWTFAADESVVPVRFWSSIREEDCMCRCGFDFERHRVAPGRKTVRLRVRLDSRRVFWSDAVTEAVKWVGRVGGYKPLPAPSCAYEPLYSTWYAFHQRLDAAVLEQECVRAAEAGLRTIIVDDGWQTSDASRGYEHCGDWQPCAEKFPDMRSHVARVHATGLKYVLWYAVPFVGVRNPMFETMSNRFLRVVKNPGYGEVGVLDPRQSSVREHLIGVYERAVREWDVDGLKLDFLGQYAQDGADVQEGVACLMDEILRRLQPLKPDLLVEFRQSYVGPGMARYGNMMRVSDCPLRPDANRAGIVGLRLTCPSSAVHSDMLEWHADETRESVARQIINCLFGTVQYSMVLGSLPEEHLRTVRHWIAFSRKHEKALLHGAFRPHLPEFEYPVVEGESAEERVVVAYAPNQVVEAASAPKRTVVVNGTSSGFVAVSSRMPGSAEVFDVAGLKVRTCDLMSGLTAVQIPESGYAIVAVRPN